MWTKIKSILKRYFVDAMSAMALGLFSSLIIGLIISQLSKISFLNFLTDNNITLENIKNTPIGFTAVCQGKDYFFIAKKQ